MEKFSEILKDLIIDKDVSLRQLAKLSNVGSAQLSRYLHGSYPSVDAAVRLADYFNCSLDYLFGLTETKETKTFKKYDMKVFVSRYEEALKINKITHWKFSKKSGLSESSLRKWKLYGENPSIESLIIIADGLSSSIDYLIGRY